MYKRLNAGLFGHTLPATEDLEAAEKMLRMPGRYAVRKKIAGGNCVFGLTPEDALKMVKELPPGMWNLSPMLEDRFRVCYGHLLDDVNGWNLHYSPTPLPCRLKQSQDKCEQKNVHGLAARLYLRGIMDDIGWFTLLDLIDAYPGHVIEFTVMANRLAAFGPSNTIIWEVRSAVAGDMTRGGGTRSGEYEFNSGWAKV